jgi:YD repeat-containing protein
VTALAPSPEEQSIAAIRARIQKREQTPTATESVWNKASDYHADHPGIVGRLGQVGAGILRGVDMAGEALAPGLASAIPSTSMNKRLNQQIDERRLASAETQSKDAAEAQDKRADAAKKGFELSHPKDAKESWEPILSGDKTIAGFRNTATGELAGPNSSSLTPDMKDIIASAKPKPEPGAGPLSAQEINDYNSGLKDRYRVLNPNAQLPPYFSLKEGATAKDFERIDKLMQQVEQASGVKATGDLARADRREREGEKTVLARDAKGRLVSETRADATASGHRIVKSSVPAGEEAKAREAHGQFDRMISNAQDAMDTLPAWNNENDRRLAMQVSHKLFESSVPVAHIGGDYVDQFLNSDDYRAMTPQGQQHFQNMLNLYSDVITLAKQETGGSRTVREALAREDAILPKPEKTAAMNLQALKKFGQRMRQDSAAHARPVDMPSQVGLIPNDAVSKLKDATTGEIVGYKTKDGKQHFFDEEK